MFLVYQALIYGILVNDMSQTYYNTFPSSFSTNIITSSQMINAMDEINISADKEYGNLLVFFKNREPAKSEEGDAFVTIGVDEENKIVYISIEPDDKKLKEFIKKIKDEKFAIIFKI